MCNNGNTVRQETRMTNRYKAAVADLNQAIDQVAQATGVTDPGARYKVFRAVAFQALLRVIEGGGLNEVVEATIADHSEYPYGYRLAGIRHRETRGEDSVSALSPVLPGTESPRYLEAIERRRALRQN